MLLSPDDLAVPESDLSELLDVVAQRTPDRHSLPVSCMGHVATDAATGDTGSPVRR
jgi:hypothetical protein